MSLQEKRLLFAMELSNKNWKVAFGDGSRVRERNIPAGSEGLLMKEAALAKEKLGLPADAPVVSCYEAGRDGFWIARMLKKHQITNYVMDPASIEVPRRARQRKTDRLDAKKLLKLLIRYVLWEERDAFSVVCVPDEADEAAMRTYRERERLQKERTAHRARIKSLGKLYGIDISHPDKVHIDRLKDWQKAPLPEELKNELKREQRRLCMIEEQLREVEKVQEVAVAAPQTEAVRKAAKLQKLRSVGMQTGWLLGHECFGWRTFTNRKRLGSFAGLAGTPFDSGETLREQGISKAGSGRIRRGMIELSWLWLRYQPDSELTRWFMERYAKGSKRSRRKGIVALARKLLIALWKYVEFDIVPEGAMLKA